MKLFSDLVYRFRKAILALTVFMTIFFLLGVPRLKVESDFIKYLPPSDPAVKLFNEVSKKFKGNSIAMVILKAPDVFTFKTLSKIDTLTRAYQGIDGVSYVMSLTNILDIKKTREGLLVGKLIEKGKIPQSHDSLSLLKKYVLSKERFRGQIVSKDGKYAAILVRLQNAAQRERIAREIRSLTENKRGKFKVFYGGLPLNMLFIDELIRGELMRLTPIAFFILLVVLFIGFRNIWGVILPMVSVLIAVTWVLGIMGWTGRPLSMVSDAVPTILLAVGSAYGIHILNRYFEEAQSQKDRKEAVKKALLKIGVPILMAGITTLVGFLSILSSSLRHLRDFGIFSSLGIFFALIGSLTLIPAILFFLPVKSFQEKTKMGARLSSRFLERLSSGIFAWKVGIIIAFALLAGGSSLFLPRLTRKVNMLEYFEKGNPIRQAWEVIDKKFGGSDQIQILTNCKDVKDPAMLKILSDMEVELEAIPYVSHPQSISDLICEMNDLVNGTYTIPPTKEGVSNLWFLIDGQDILDLMITKDRKDALIQASIATEETGIERMITERADSIIKKMPKEYIYLSEDSVQSEFKDTLKLWRANRSAHLVALELKRSSINLPEAKISSQIYGFLKNPKPEVIEIEPSLIQDLRSYFDSDEADVILKDPNDIVRISTVLAEFFVNFPDASEMDVEKALREFLPKKVIEEDPEAPTYASRTILSRYHNLLKRKRLDALYKNISSTIQDPFDSSLAKAIRDHLSLSLDPWTLLPARDYPDLIKFGKVKKIEVKQTGFPLIYKKLDDRLIRSQVQSLLLALIAVFVLVSLEFGSVMGGFLSLIPILFTLIMNFGVMGLLKIPLDYATVMVGSISVGIGIDYTIHILSRFRHEYIREKDPRKALKTTLGTTGKAVIINALSVAFGFLILLLASMVPLRRAGFLLAFTMIVSSLAALLLLTSILLLTHAAFAFKKNRKE